MYTSEQKILSLAALQAKIKVWQLRQYKIVFTNGCFDLLHLGHVDYLEKAKQLGDILIVGLNTDASVCRLKGEQRPIQDEHSRARVMAALEFVDAVVYFEEDTPYELIKALQPDILVKGNDYTPEAIVGADIVQAKQGEVLTVELVSGYSTSNIIKKIRAIND